MIRCWTVFHEEMLLVSVSIKKSKEICCPKYIPKEYTYFSLSSLGYIIKYMQLQIFFVKEGFKKLQQSQRGLLITPSVEDPSLR